MPACSMRCVSLVPLIFTGQSSLLPGRGRGSRGRCAGVAALDAFLLVGVPAEGPRDGELSELVPDHVLGDEHIEEHAAVVHLEGVPDELGDDGAAAGPCLDGLAPARGVELLDLAVKLLDDERTFLQTASHVSVLSPES